MKKLWMASWVALVVAACGSSSSPKPTDSPASNAGSTTEVESPTVAGNALTGATVITVEAMPAGTVTSKGLSTDAYVVARAVNAAAPTQTPGGALRKCIDTVRITFGDERGSFGTLGFCNSGEVTSETPLEGAELTRGDDTVAVTLADEPTLRLIIVSLLQPTP